MSVAARVPRRGAVPAAGFDTTGSALETSLAEGLHDELAGIALKALSHRRTVIPGARGNARTKH